jgi:DNA replication protein DnaC
MTDDENLKARIFAEEAAIRAQARLDRYLAKRPERFARPGEVNPKIAEWAGAVLAGEARDLVLFGSTGTGKTWSAWRAGELLLRAGYDGTIDVVNAWRFKLAATPPLDTDALLKLTTAGILVLDDEGAVRISDWDSDHLYGILNERSEHCRPTIVTANIEGHPAGDPRTPFEVLFGQRIASRLAENVTAVKFEGPDRRRQQP